MGETKPQLCCIECLEPINGRLIRYVEETEQDMHGDGYGWSRWVTTDAAVYCSDDCLAKFLSEPAPPPVPGVPPEKEPTT